ncbi:uncharacterized protein LOC113345412 [Papaver somniferum]|uniref:uncharacterized protein LOC113345412 n=1 Tax=Papaver somniferum TaxID=3469 RepID=UPI000E7050B6|nr:uncharacterized protein LOC113345412 [Papaver somniferum]
MPVTYLPVQVIQCFNSTSNLVLFHGYFHMFILAVIGDSFRLLRMKFFLQYSLPTSVNYGSVATQVKGMQLFRYPTVIHSMYCTVLKSYVFYQLWGLPYQTMGGYIKFQFYVRVVGTQRWFTVNSTIHVLLVVTLWSCELVPTVLRSVGIILTQLWYLWFSPAKHSSWTAYLLMGVRLLVWTDAHALMNFLKYMVYERFSIRARVAHYVVKHCDTRNQIFKDDYFHMLLRQFLPYTIDFTKVLWSRLKRKKKKTSIWSVKGNEYYGHSHVSVIWSQSQVKGILLGGMYPLVGANSHPSSLHNPEFSSHYNSPEI